QANQADNLDAGFQQLVAASLLSIGRSSAVDGPALFFADRAGVVDGVTQDVHDATQSLLTDRYGDTGAGVDDVQATLEAFGRTHGDGTVNTVAQLQLDLQGGLGASNFQRVIDVMYHIARTFHVTNGTI